MTETIITVFLILLIIIFIVVAIIIGCTTRPYCPKCKSKMREQPPHRNKEVYECEECNKEWIQL